MGGLNPNGWLMSWKSLLKWMMFINGITSPMTDWLVVWNLFFFHTLGISSSQLTFILFRGVAKNHQPDYFVLHTSKCSCAFHIKTCTAACKKCVFAVYHSNKPIPLYSHSLKHSLKLWSQMWCHPLDPPFGFCGCL